MEDNYQTNADGGRLKRCTLCRVRKPLADYHFSRTNGAHLARCKACIGEVNRINRVKNREARLERERIVRRVAKLRSVYGITLEAYGNALVAQRDRCADCRQPETVKLRGHVRPLSVRQAAYGGPFDLICMRCGCAEHYARMRKPQSGVAPC